MTICTIDVHARDVVAKMIAAKARAPAGPAGIRGVRLALGPQPGTLGPAAHLEVPGGR